MRIALIVMLSMLGCLAYAQDPTPQLANPNITILQRDMEHMGRDLTNFKSDIVKNIDNLKSDIKEDISRSSASLEREVDGLRTVLLSAAGVIIVLVVGIQAYLINRLNKFEEILMRQASTPPQAPPAQQIGPVAL